MYRNGNASLGSLSSATRAAPPGFTTRNPKGNLVSAYLYGCRMHISVPFLREETADRRHFQLPTKTTFVFFRTEEAYGQKPHTWYSPTCSDRTLWYHFAPSIYKTRTHQECSRNILLLCPSKVKRLATTEDYKRLIGIGLSNLKPQNSKLIPS